MVPELKTTCLGFINYEFPINKCICGFNIKPCEGSCKTCCTMMVWHFNPLLSGLLEPAHWDDPASYAYNLKEPCFAKLCEYILKTQCAGSTKCCSVCNFSLVNHYLVLKACYNLAAVKH